MAPQLKKKVDVICTDEERLVIEMYATDAIVEDAKNYGTVTSADGVSHFYVVDVDPRYDFKEVVDHISAQA